MLKVDLGRNGGRVHFVEQPRIDPARVIQLVQSRPETFHLDGRDKLRISRDLPEPDSRFDALTELFDQIQSREAA